MKNYNSEFSDTSTRGLTVNSGHTPSIRQSYLHFPIFISLCHTFLNNVLLLSVEVPISNVLYYY